MKTNYFISRIIEFILSAYAVINLITLGYSSQEIHNYFHPYTSIVFYENNAGLFILLPTILIIPILLILKKYRFNLSARMDRNPFHSDGNRGGKMRMIRNSSFIFLFLFAMVMSFLKFDHNNLTNELNNNASCAAVLGLYGVIYYIAWEKLKLYSESI